MQGSEGGHVAAVLMTCSLWNKKLLCACGCVCVSIHTPHVCMCVSMCVSIPHMHVCMCRPEADAPVSPPSVPGYRCSHCGQLLSATED